MKETAAKDKVWYSHASQSGNATGRREGSKHLQVHVAGVTHTALASLHLHCATGIDPDLLRCFVEDICQYHDLGKYVPDFQHYLLGQGAYDPVLKQHAAFGAQVFWQQWKDRDPALAMLGWVLIIRHHANLPDWNGLEAWYSECANRQRFERQARKVLTQLRAIVADSMLPLGPQHFAWPEDQLLDAVDDWMYQPHIAHYFLCNYSFSLLIGSDKLDASDTLRYERKSIPHDLVGRYIAGMSKGAVPSLQNRQREAARAEVLSHLHNQSILDQKLFTLTAPTGIGKTLTALDFALQLRQKVEAAEGHSPAIIYALPFVNIISQSLSIYEEVLAEHGLVLGHYQYADLFGAEKTTPEQEQALLDREDLDELIDRRRQQLESWQADVVITSFVQLLQTLIGYRNKLLKKFHHLAGCILILDEVQNIDLQQLPLVGAVLHCLSLHLNARVLVMTATRPQLYELAWEHILSSREIPRPAPLELLTSHKDYFRQLNRTRILPDLQLREEPEEWLDFLSKTWTPQYSALIVVNTVGHSLLLFDCIKDWLSDQGYETPIYYLSTNLSPAHRMQRIQEVRKALSQGNKPILVSTQCIEAGVDMDFDMGYRDLGPLDSLVQVAGRINRHNDPARAASPLYVLHSGQCRKIYGSITEEQVIKSLHEASASHGPSIPEQAYLSMVETYFGATSDRASFNPAVAIFEAMESLRYCTDDPNTTDVAAFRVIKESSHCIALFVPYDAPQRGKADIWPATAALAAWQQMQDSYGEARKQLMAAFRLRHQNDFQQCIITVPSSLAGAQRLQNTAEELWEGLWLIPPAQLEAYYDSETGFRRKAEKQSYADIF